LIDFDNDELAGGMTLIQRTIVPYWNNTVRPGSIVCHTKSEEKMIEMATDSLMMSLSLKNVSHRGQWL
jgi:hypothetical protein